MKRPEPPELHMTLEGEFVSPPTPPLSTRILFWSIVVALIAGGLALAFVALWIAMVMLPIAIGAGVVGYLMFRYKMWRAGGQIAGQRDLWAPPPGR